MAETFAASLKAFEKKVKEQALNIIRESAQDVIEDAQLPKAMGGRMPVVTGNLRNSLQSSLNGSGLTSGEQSYILTIASMELGDLVTFGWTAEYALRQEFGFTGTDAWVETMTNRAISLLGSPLLSGLSSLKQTQQGYHNGS